MRAMAVLAALTAVVWAAEARVVAMVAVSVDTAPVAARVKVREAEATVAAAAVGSVWAGVAVGWPEELSTHLNVRVSETT